MMLLLIVKVLGMLLLWIDGLRVTTNARNTATLSIIEKRENGTLRDHAWPRRPSLDNSTVHTFDAMGKRVGEQVKVPVGVLGRSATWVSDALNCMQQTTGVVQ